VLNGEQQHQRAMTNGQRPVMNGGNMNGFGGAMLKDGSFSPSPRLSSPHHQRPGTGSTHSTLNRSRYQQANFNQNFIPNGVCHGGVSLANYPLPPPPPPPDVAYIALASLTTDHTPEIDFSPPQQHHLIHSTMNGHHSNGGHHHTADSFIDQTNGHIPQPELYRM